MSNESENRDGVCGPVCLFCNSDENTYYAEAETTTPNGEPIDPTSPEAIPHYYCSGCGNLMIISTGEWIRF